MVTSAQLFSFVVFYVVFVHGEKVDQGHRESHKEKDFLSQLRYKRYATGRVPLAYLQNLKLNGGNFDVDEDINPYAAVEKRYRSNSLQANPAASHFREVQVRQVRRPAGPSLPDDLSPAQLHNFLQYYGTNGGLYENANSDLLGLGDPGVGPLSDAELEALLMLLEGYRLQQGTSHNPSLGEDENPILGKRETGRKRGGPLSRSQLGREEPMSFENSYGDNYPVFLGQKRSKRVGGSLLQNKMTPSVVRIKKETSPEVEASLDKVFGNAKGESRSGNKQSIPTTAISSSADQIPAPASLSLPSSVQKKAIDWTRHFGIDKRQGLSGAPTEPKESETKVDESKHADVTTSKDEPEKTVASTTSSVGSVASAVEAKLTTGQQKHAEEKAAKLKAKKERSKQENEADEKADRKWILKEFYKNLAMSTNVKRKRESPSESEQSDIEKLEKIERKMEEAGDEIIWDALKYTGKNKDSQLSPEELAHVKKEIIEKLSAAYSLEKVREALEEFRQELAQLKEKQQQYY